MTHCRAALVASRRAPSFIYTPLTGITDWVQAYWAEDPGWTNPGNGVDVTSWRNAGSEGGNATNIIAGVSIPEFRASVASLNSKSAIEFYSSASNGLRNTTGAVQARPYTTMVVFEFTTTGVNRTVIDSSTQAQRGQIMAGSTYGLTVRDGNTQAVVISGGSTPAGRFVILCEFNGAATHVRINRTAYTVTTGTASPPVGGVSLGIQAGNSGPMAGFIAFAGRVNRALTTQEITDFEDWSLDYYGV